MKEQAKKKVLQALKNRMRKAGNDGLMGGMAVSVKAEDKKGLLEGLEKAKEVVKKQELPESEEECPYAKLSKDEIEEKISKLKDMLSNKE